VRPDPYVLANELSVARAELTRLIADRDEALAIADRHRLTCQGVEEDFHALEENNERLRGALALCVAALDAVEDLGFYNSQLTSAQFRSEVERVENSVRVTREAAKAAMEHRDG
jgi:hypothetical protein